MLLYPVMSMLLTLMPGRLHAAETADFIHGPSPEFSLHCPDVDQLRTGNFGQWQPLNILGEELASSADRERFRLFVKKFAKARWSSDYLENAHCFYQGKDPVFDQIVLAHDAFSPGKASCWQWLVPRQLATCKSENVLDCPFVF